MRLSFRLRTILGIALIEAVLLGLLLTLGWNYLVSSTEAEFEQRSQATVRAFSVAAQNGLISHDLASLTALTREMLDYPGVLYARVSDVDRHVVAAAGNLTLASPEPPVAAASRLQPQAGVLHVLAVVQAAGVEFGRVEVGVSAAELQQRLDTARRYGVGLALLEMALVAMFSWALGGFLTRQLADLSTASVALADGALGVQIPVRGHDELARTAESFNRMSAQLDRTYATLAHREQDLRQVLDATQDAIVVIDERGLIESFNAGAEAMFGHAAVDAIGRNVSLIVPEPHRAQHDAYLQRFLTTGVTAIMGREREFEAAHRDGARLWVALRVNELPAPAAATVTGEPPRRRFIGVLHDITARKRAEDELRHAKDAAEDAANAKSEFLANMSHEIRTPMHGVLGSIEMLRETPLSPEQQRHLETAAASASLLLGVIDEILDFSRLEAGKLRIESIDFDLRRTVEDVTAMLAQRAHAKRVEMACYIAPEVPLMMRGDPIRLRQVLVNLVGNAIKFTDQGEVVVTVTRVADAASGALLRFEVRDTGIGIAADKQAGLFQPFTQADSTTSRRFGGSGLGLSIAKRLVGLMDGEIGFSSREGAGSTFWFTLPALLPDVGNSSPRLNGLAGTRVLVVDDNATNRIILHRYLTAWGSQSSSAATGDEALAKLQDAAIAGRPYDVALLDLNMPGMDGYELMRRIQAEPALRSMPLLMLSSSMQDPARLAGLRVDVWLDKPVRQSDLHDAIATVLNGRAPVAAPAPAGRLPQFGGERVLLVEDSPVTRDVGANMLRKRGLTVELATDGIEAVTAMQRGRHDVVLMDVQMPGMDGYAATREIRAWEAATGRPRTPIIALTAHALPADRDKCLAAGMDDYLTKPYSGESLATLIARWLVPPGQMPAAAPVPAAPVLDPVRLAEVRAVMGAELPLLLERVGESLQAQMAQLAEAVGQGDAARSREVMHRLKNTAGDIGASRLHALAGAQERALAADPPVLPPLGELQHLCTEALAAVHELGSTT